MNTIDRVKIILESLESFKEEPPTANALSRFCVLTGCLLTEVRDLVEEIELGDRRVKNDLAGEKLG